MPKQPRPAAFYVEEQQVMDLALERGKSIRLDFARLGTAIRFRQTCYEFRKAVSRELAQQQSISQSNLFTAPLEQYNEYDLITIIIGQDSPEGKPRKQKEYNKDEPGYLTLHIQSTINRKVERIVDPTTGQEIES